jgi:hypothetical protein
MLSRGELDELEARCREVPIRASAYLTEDPVMALVETVVDYQMHTTAVRALQHFERERLPALHSIAALRDCLAAFPDSPRATSNWH